MENETERKSTDRFPCPQCGGDMVFDPSNQALDCPYCKHAVRIEGSTDSIKEIDLAAGEAECSTDWGSSTKVIHCDTCGADIVLEDHRVSEHCAFCGSTHTVRLDELPGIRPGSVLPFSVHQGKAKASFAKWLNSRYLAPGDLKTKHTTQRLTGTYIPFWTYDADTYSPYTAQKGTHYWVTQTVPVTRNGKTVHETRQVRKTRWNFVNGTYGEFFDDVLVHASARLDNILGKKVGNFNLKQLVDYRPEYLSGFVAEKYSIGLKPGFEKAKDDIRERIRRGIIRRINGDEVRALNFRTSYDKVTFKHILLPLWVSSYSYKGQIYHFVVNGQSGEVQGTAPVSAVKVAGIVIAVLAVIAVVIMMANQ